MQLKLTISSNPEYMQATQMNVLMKIEEMSRLDRIRNENISYREKSQRESVLYKVKNRQEKWKIRLEELSAERTKRGWGAQDH